MTDFSKFKVAKKVNSVSSSIRVSKQVVQEVEEVKKKAIKKKTIDVALSYCRKVFQGCEKCGIETVFNTVDGGLICSSCDWGYKLKEKQLEIKPQVTGFFFL